MFNSNDDKKAKEFLENLRNKLQVAKDEKFTFLLLGRTGVGKSSTVNSLIGKQVAKIGDYEPTTMQVEVYDSEISGIKFVIVDTPGLCDELEDVGNDHQYMGLIRSKVKQVDSMWFVSRLDDTRVSSDEKRGIKIISEAFSPKIWQYAIIVFTFANNVNREKYSIALEKRTELIRKEIAKYTGIATANNIPAVAVDNTSEKTPNGEKWLGELFTQVYARMSEKGAIPFLMATVKRIKLSNEGVSEREIPTNIYYEAPKYEAPKYEAPKYEAPKSAPIELDRRQAKIVKQKTEEVLGIMVGAASGASIGAVIGSVAGGPVGAAVGGAVGAVVGFVEKIWRFLK